MVKPTGWVVDMRHYLDEETGDLPDGLPATVLTLALYFGSIVAWVTDHLLHEDWHTNVPCRRESWPPALPRRHHGRTESHVRIHFVAVSRVRRQRADPRVGGHAVESAGRRPCDIGRHAAGDEPLTACLEDER